MYILMAVLTLGALSAVADSAVVGDGLVYRIATDKAKYIPGEPIVVTAILSNASDRVREVRLPTWSEHVVSYSAYTPKDSGPQWSRVADVGDCSKRVVSLKPGEKAESSIELVFALYWGRRFSALSPGAWRLRSRYHFADMGSERYELDVLLSDEIVFQVLEPEGELKVEHDEFMNAMGDADREKRFRKLSAYVENHKTGLFCLPALQEMGRHLWRKGDMEGNVRIKQKIRKMKVSSENSDSACLAEAQLLESLGRLEEALQAIDDESVKRSPRLDKLRESLRMRVKK